MGFVNKMISNKNLFLFTTLILIVQTVSVTALERCGNGICEDSESYKLCPEDCMSGVKDYYCDMVEDGRCDPDCTQGDVDCEGQKRLKKKEVLTIKSETGSKKSVLRLLASVIVVMALILGAYLLYKKINAQKLEDYPYQNKNLNNQYYGSNSESYQPYYPRR